MPELAVDLTAVRKKQYEIAIGDAIGSCIIDAGFSIGIGPLLFPITVSGRLAETTGLYALFASIVVITTLALRERLDRKAEHCSSFSTGFPMWYSTFKLIILPFQIQTI